METPFPPFEPNGPDDSARGPRLREIPLRLVFPNLITVLAICAGLTGIRLAFENRYELAVSMVLLAAFLDGIDGRVARLMKATSKFGAQMDSLADIVNFGVAPALVVYVFALDQARSLGWIAALIYAIAAGLRLARFNVMAERENKASWQSEYFVGVLKRRSRMPCWCCCRSISASSGWRRTAPSPISRRSTPCSSPSCLSA